MVVNVFAAIRWDRAVLWLPAVVLGTGLVLGVMILLGRAFAATVREAQHPRVLMGGLVLVVGAVVLMTWLGVTLPKE
jgi:hypothetical protein